MVSGQLFKLFGKSPIAPLQKHMEKVYECAKTLIPFTDAAIDNQWELAEQHQKLVTQYEHDADDIKKDIRTHMPKGLFLPVPREDLLEILHMQDKIANKAKDIAGIILGRQMQIPQAISQNYKDFLARCVDSAYKTHEAADELDQLIETGFRGAEVNVVEDMINEIRDIEHDTDEMKIVIRKKLFAIETTLAPVDVIFLYKIIDWTGEIADHAEQVGNRMELLLAQ